MLRYCTFLSPPAHSAILWLPGLHLRYVEASQLQVWGHGPLCKVLPDHAAGGQPSGRRSPPGWGGQQGLEGGARGPGGATYGSLRVCSPGLVWLQGMKDYTECVTVRSSCRSNPWVKKGKCSSYCTSQWIISVCADTVWWNVAWTQEQHQGQGPGSLYFAKKVLN